MSGVVLRILIRLNLILRRLFWKTLLRIYGGSMGKNVNIFEGVKIAFKRGCPVTIGDNVSIQKGVVISTSETGKIRIGNNVYVGEYSVITSNQEIEIGDNVLISPHNDIVDFNHNYQDPNIPIEHQGVTAKKITIEEDVWIGAGCKILRGVTIGKGSVVGAGSVVTKNVPSYHVVIGNPARTIKQREKQKNGKR